MSPLPDYRPKQLSLGPLETEILNIIWELKCVAVKDVHERILSDPDRELAYTSVTTVLNRLTNKGWLKTYKQGRVFYWEALVSKEEATAIKSYEQLNQFLAISNPDVVASFADRLDTTSLDRLEAIASRIEEIRRQRGQK